MVPTRAAEICRWFKDRLRHFVGFQLQSVTFVQQTDDLVHRLASVTGV